MPLCEEGVYAQFLSISQVFFQLSDDLPQCLLDFVLHLILIRGRTDYSDLIF